MPKTGSVVTIAMSLSHSSLIGRKRWTLGKKTLKIQLTRRLPCYPFDVDLRAIVRKPTHQFPQIIN